MRKANARQDHGPHGSLYRKSKTCVALICSLLLFISASVMAEDVVQIVKDINPGAADSLPDDFTVYDGKFYFGADDGNNGQELWVSDGTEAGTTMLKDINVGNNTSSSPAEFAVFDGMLYFAADDGLHGRELWVSDGTEAGTTMLKDIHAGTNKGSSPSGLTVFNDKLYFGAGDGVNGRELWRSDGTEAGTVLAEDINPGSGSSSPSGFALLDNQLYFEADDGTSGSEPWVLKPATACEYPLNATLQQVAPWGPALINGSPTVDALVDVSGTVSQALAFYPTGDSDGYQAMAMKSEMADTYPPSGELGDEPLPASGVIGYQVNINKLFDPTNSSASSAGMEVTFASGTLTNNMAVTVGNHFLAPDSRLAYVRLLEDSSIVSQTLLEVGTDIGETATVGISIDRTNKKVYWSLDGGAPQAFQSGGVDHVYGHNGTHGFFMVNANTGGQDVTGDSIVGDSNSSTLVTCAPQMTEQFRPGAVDIEGTEI